MRPKRQEDVVNDYAWQRDEELSQLDATFPLSCSFPSYLRHYALEWSWGKRGLAIETLEGKHIGNCAYFNVNKAKSEAEIGILIGDRDYWNKGYGGEAVSLLVDYLGKQGTARIRLKTLDWNVRAQKCFAKCGFVPCGVYHQDGHSFIVMEIKL